jgi:hypothetical protein
LLLAVTCLRAEMPLRHAGMEYAISIFGFILLLMAISIIFTRDLRMKKIGFIVSVLIIVFACKKEKNTNNSNIPNQSVNIVIYPNDPQFVSTIGVPGGWCYITGGNKGIIVYRSTNTDFIAYERTCTYDPSTNSAIVVMSDNITIRDTVCGSKFNMLNATVTQGPAAASLKTYTCQYDGSALHIYN